MILVKSFNIWDINDKTNPEVIALENLLKENPSYIKRYWQQSGPCSNWGYVIFRPMTEEENKEQHEYEKALLKR